MSFNFPEQLKVVLGGSNQPIAAANALSVGDYICMKNVNKAWAIVVHVGTNDTDLTVRVSLSGTGAVAGNTIQLYDGTGTGSPIGTSYPLTATDITNGFADVRQRSTDDRVEIGDWLSALEERLADGTLEWYADERVESRQVVVRQGVQAAWVDEASGQGAASIWGRHAP